ncbi:heme-binding protein [Chondromyces crocatus]|uniref:heme-binding protein n=1 Tax=Chondromyces crocatus TaxID=52 RepID=UPI00316AC245
MITLRMGARTSELQSRRNRATTRASRGPIRTADTARTMSEEDGATARRGDPSGTLEERRSSKRDPSTATASSTSGPEPASSGPKPASTEPSERPGLHRPRHEDADQGPRPPRPARRPLYGLEQTSGGLIPFAGGIPLRDERGAFIGAIGVSASSVEQDQRVAAAGIAASTP